MHYSPNALHWSTNKLLLMLKKYSLLVILLSFVTYSNAQDKGYIGLSVGPSFPMGDYGSSSFNNADAGLAQTGLMLDLSFGYKLGNNFGIAALLRTQANPIDEDVFDVFSFPGISMTVKTEPWGIVNFLFGGYATVPIGEVKVNFDARALLGFAGATSPELDMTISDGVTSEWVRQSSETSTSFAYLFGAGFRFNVGSKICLLTNIDYSSTSAEFDVTTTSSAGESETGSIEQTLSTVNLSVGVGIRL